jgi:hypothetical protein
MNPTLPIDPSAGATLEVGAAPVALRLPAGSAIFTVRGEAWITQERLADDIILGPGERFDVPNRELLVISATRGPATLFVAEPAAARRHTTRDVVDFARRHAGQLRREDSRYLAGALAAALRDLAGRVRVLVTPGQRAPTH